MLAVYARDSTVDKWFIRKLEKDIQKAKEKAKEIYEKLVMLGYEEPQTAIGKIDTTKQINFFVGFKTPIKPFKIVEK